MAASERPAPRGVPRSAASNAAARTARIYAVVGRIPRGKVATYGEVAAMAGLPAGHRQVARAMSVCPAGLPWHRVVGKKDLRRAKISILDPHGAATQRARLERERVAFDGAGFIVLARSGWQKR